MDKEAALSFLAQLCTLVDFSTKGGTFCNIWRYLDMKLTLRSFGAAVTAIAVAQAQCPDYTTFSQVSSSEMNHSSRFLTQK